MQDRSDSAQLNERVASIFKCVMLRAEHYNFNEATRNVGWLTAEQQRNNIHTQSCNAFNIPAQLQAGQ
jgi:hypothetical protein